MQIKGEAMRFGCPFETRKLMRLSELSFNLTNGDYLTPASGVAARSITEQQGLTEVDE
jgi:hypothetical protein